MQDTSSGVRKRSIKLFKSIYAATDVHAQRVDIARALVLRLADEDDQVKDLALKTLEELWFPPTPALKPRSNSSDNGAAAAKEALQSRMLVLMDVAEKYGPAVEELLHRLGDAMVNDILGIIGVALEELRDFSSSGPSNCKMQWRRPGLSPFVYVCALVQ